MSRLQSSPRESPTALSHLPGIKGNQPLSKIVDRGIIHALGSLMIGDHAKVLRAGHSSSRAAAALSSIMPEQHQGQNLQIADHLCGLAGGFDAVERLRVALFLISNSFKISDPDDFLFRSNIRKNWESFSPHETNGTYHMEQTRLVINNEDQAIMAVFYISGLDTVSNLRYLQSLGGATAYAILHKLFSSAVRSQDIRIVRMALEAGLSPDIPIFFNGSSGPPLLLASKFKDSRVALEMCHLLISYGSGQKDPQVLQETLCEAIRSENNGLVEHLFLQNIPITGQVIQCAIEWKSPKILSRLLDIDRDVNKRASCNSQGDISLLGLAVLRKDVSLVKELLELGANVDAIEDLEFRGSWRKSTTLGLALRFDLESMLDLLLRAHPNINYHDASEVYIPPVLVSVEYGTGNTTRRLLSAGADVTAVDVNRDMNIVHRAIARGDLELSWLLVSHGAKAEPNEIEDSYTSILYEHVTMNNRDTVLSLLNWGARKNDIYDQVPDTILGAAITGGHCELVEYFVNVGATNIGQKLIQIGNLRTALYLKQTALLPEILHRYGQPILVSAIIGFSEWKDDGLLQFLLDHNVDKQPEAVGLEPFSPTEKISEGSRWFGRHLKLSSVCTSPLEAVIFFMDFPESLFLAKLLIQRGAVVGDLELRTAVQDYERHTENFEILQLLLDNLSHQKCAVPNAFVEALRHAHTAFLVQRFLDIGLDPGGKVIQGASDSIFIYHLHGVSDLEVDESILEAAVTRCDSATLRTLLSSRAWTAVEIGRALTIALNYGQEILAQDLLDAGSDVNQTIDTRYKYPPLWIAIKNQNTRLTRHLIALGADIEYGESDTDGRPTRRYETTLCMAVNTGNKNLVQILFDAGAHVNHPASSLHGRAALQAAAEVGSVQIVDMLLDAGADPNLAPAEESGGTALQFAAIKGYIGIARKLLARGADVNGQKSLRNGRTALEGAAEHGRIDMLQLLLNEGASIEGACRRQYIRAVKLAKINAELGAAKLLTDHGGWTDRDERQFENEKFDSYEFSEKSDPWLDFTILSSYIDEHDA